MINHTEYCQKQQAEYREAVEKYDQNWPNACKACGGAGYFVYAYDPSPSGVSLAPGYLYDADPCEACIEQGKCPRCGKAAWTDDDWNGEFATCPHCGWTDNPKADQPDRVRPVEPDCYCWESWNLQRG